MSITAAQLIAKVGVEGSDKAKADLQSVGGAVTSAGGLFKSALGGPISLVAGVAGKAFTFLKGQLEDSIKLAMDHQDVMAQTAQAIKSTGDASGLSAGQIGDMATALSKTTKFSEDNIQSGENLLLTFTGLGKQAFPLATKAMLDLSQATGQDMKSSAIQLGKALNDPLTGMSALQRVGVTFSDTEKQQIKTAMAHNDVLGAQKVMLKELNTEFGGSAQAAGKTLAGALAILKNNFDDLKEKVGGAVIPIFSNLVGMINVDVMPLFEKLGPIIGNVVSYFKSFDLTSIIYAWHQLVIVVEDLLDPLGKGTISVGNFSGTFVALKNNFSLFLASGIKNVAGIIQTIADTIRNLSNGQGPGFILALSNGFREFLPLIQRVGQLMGSELLREFKDIGAAAQQVGQWFMSSVVPALRQAEPGFANLAKTVLTTVIPAMIQIRGVIVDVIEHAFKVFGPIIEKIIPPLIKLAGIMANDLANGIKVVMPYVKQAATEIGKFADEVMNRVAPIIKQFLDNLKVELDFFKAHWSQIWSIVGPILRGSWDEIVGIVKIAWALVSGIIKIGLDVLSGNWKGAWNDLKDMLGGVWDGIRGVISGGLEMINGLFAGLPGQALQWGENLISSFIQGIQNMIGGVASAAQNVMTTVEDFIGVHSPTRKGAGKTLDQWGKNLVKQFASDIESHSPKAHAAAEGMMSGVLKKVKEYQKEIAAAHLSGNTALEKSLQGQRSQYALLLKDYKDELLTHNIAFSSSAKNATDPILFGHAAHKKGTATHATGASTGSALTGKLLQEIANNTLKLVTLTTTSMANGGGALSSFGGGQNRYQFPQLGVGNVSVQVNPPSIYLDGRTLAFGLMPYITDNIRYGTGSHL